MLFSEFCGKFALCMENSLLLRAFGENRLNLSLVEFGPDIVMRRNIVCREHHQIPLGKFVKVPEPHHQVLCAIQAEGNVASIFGVKSSIRIRSEIYDITGITAVRFNLTGWASSVFPRVVYRDLRVSTI